MRKTIAATLALCLCMALPLGAWAESADAGQLLISATVIPAQEAAIKAPMTGDLEPFSLRVGDAVASGSTLFTIKPQSVYADVDGTVAIAYSQPGDIADAAVTRYGAVVLIEHENRYELNCTNNTGYNSTANRNLYVGSSVYLRSSDEKHFADGVITQVNGRQFTVAVVGGDLEYNKDVKVYREANYNDKSLLAREKLLDVVEPVSVTASGTILTMDVQRGDEVKKGDLLFTYVPDVLEPELRGKNNATAIQADGDIVISSLDVTQGAGVQKDQVLCTVYQTGDYQLSGEVEESDLGRIAVGDSVSVAFEELGLDAMTATVAGISPLGSEADTSKYTVYFDFDVPEGVQVGMHATVEK